MTVNPSIGGVSAAHAGPVASRLDSLGVIRAEGADAASFLHGQLTQDVTSMGATEARLAGYCSAKGRLLASFVLLRPTADMVLLVCSADLLAPTLKRLSMFVLRAKCRLSDASAEFAPWGVIGALPGAPAAPEPAWSARALPATDGAAAGWAVRVPSAGPVPRYLVIAPGDAPPPALAGCEPALPEAWDLAEVQAGLPRITAATAEQFVPQMINLELIGGVNFQKGCYPGQEVVARSQYRGTVKRRMAHFATTAAAGPGAELFHDSDPTQPAGLVVNAAGPAGNTALLAEVKLAALMAPGHWHLGAPDGALLDRRALPYTWPAEAEGSSAAA
jgi:tRNA-modifying protein YgfZ